MMCYASLFSGIEAATVAWEPLGWRPACFCEIDPFPSAVLAERYPDVPNLGDIRQVDWSVLHGQVDLVVGGSPCQSFSIAGNREGLEGESGLMWEYVRAVREIRPEWCVWENVPGALSSSDGEDFGCLLRSLDALGYGLAWRVLDAQFFGVAQRRERLFLVGHLGDARACEVLFESESLRWDTPSSREKRKALTKRVKGGPGEASAVCMTDTQPNTMVSGETCGTPTHRMYKDAPVVAVSGNQRGELRFQGGDGEVCGAIPAHSSGKQIQAVVQGRVVRRLTPRECERLQGFPDDWTLVPYRGRPADRCPDTPRYRAIGNSMAVPVMRWIGKRIQEVMDREETEE